MRQVFIVEVNSDMSEEGAALALESTIGRSMQFQDVTVKAPERGPTEWFAAGALASAAYSLRKGTTTAAEMADRIDELALICFPGMNGLNPDGSPKGPEQV